MSLEWRGVMLVYVTLIMTLRFTIVARKLVFGIVAVFLYYLHAFDELPFFLGALLADHSIDLQQHNYDMPEKWTRYIPRLFQNYWPTATIMLGLFVGSYPSFSPEYAGWSRFLAALAWRILPEAGTVPNLNISIHLQTNTLNRGRRSITSIRYLLWRLSNPLSSPQ